MHPLMHNLSPPVLSPIHILHPAQLYWSNYFLIEVDSPPELSD